ncbi:DEAD/DEAH box helicase [Lederbergia galactosidilytica]|uniref:DEAD-box ATP-dependent RNA helicase CshB n=1 Tax=Lederbergia galactosidilytica TaxID=217031 RepID=A0A178A6H8_9BACI|nr:DEAD/DEAH box helicase [Lederbergia galactosidilytica]KRG15569.1 DEAD/DEAH box helicase [Virgibacillus soli]MBP1914799.1 ATP-dependent RNA helicase CshB [Lederbergia galactosidilytica]OAK74698.1 DEAD/DEAH box helicase [Lederbergia galactosidilytica]
MNHDFNQFKLQPFIIQAIEKMGFRQPTEIQQKMIPLILQGHSAIGQSQTGTGKTHAYLLPIVQSIDPEQKHVQAVITVPTRELADQIYQEILNLIQFDPANMITAKRFIGGTDKQRDVGRLKEQPHIIVGTPGRIHDLIREQALFVHKANMLVIDEADLMLDMGFLHDVDQVAARMPEDLQMLVFSATIPEKIKPFLKKYMENPKYEQVDPENIAAENIEHILVPLKSREKVDLITDMLQSYNPYLAIIFVNTKQMADIVADKLIERGLKVGRLHGDISPRERKRVMKQIRQLDFQYIVATDLAARGIDIQGVSHIINYELPKDLDFYIHRAGRTARAGNKGIAVTIYQPSDEDALAKLEKMGILFTHMDFERGNWVESTDRNRRKKRQKSVSEEELKAKQLIRKPKQVKPGYKKKMQKQKEQIIRREKKAKNRNK